MVNTGNINVKSNLCNLLENCSTKQKTVKNICEKKRKIVKKNVEKLPFILSPFIHILAGFSRSSTPTNENVIKSGLELDQNVYLQ